MPSTSVREELAACIDRYARKNGGDVPVVVRMTLSKYLRLGLELGYCLKYAGPTRIEFFLSESEKREVLRAG